MIQKYSMMFSLLPFGAVGTRLVHLNLDKVPSFSSMVSSRNLIEGTICYNETADFYESGDIELDPLMFLDNSNFDQDCQYNNDFSSGVCHHKDYFVDASSACMSVGGNMHLMHGETTCYGGLKYTFLDLPLCLSTSCNSHEVVDFINENLSLETDNYGCATKLTLADTCYEDPDGKFIFDVASDMLDEAADNFQVVKKCKWLERKSSRMIRKYCKNEVESFESDVSLFDKASTVCPFTCARMNKFLMKVKPNGTVKTKSCKWLSQQNRNKQGKFCTKNISSGGYHPAAIMCPHVCCECSEHDRV